MRTSRDGRPGRSWQTRSSGSARTLRRRSRGVASPPMAEPEPAGDPPSYLLVNLAAAVSAELSGPEPLRGGDLGRLRVHEPAAMAVVGGRIAHIGEPDDVKLHHRDLPVRDGHRWIALPGLVDCHTHPAF